MTPESTAIDCIDLVEIATDYFEGKLSPGEVMRLEAHLTACDGCTEYLRQMRAVQTTLGELQPERLPASSRKRLLDTFRKWKAEANP